MKTPILDFVRRYAKSNTVRAHMPGHKGEGALGVEALDLTEIDGADSLYDAEGIIRESEENASALFGARTFYSTEGSSLAIRAMLALVVKKCRNGGEKPLILAGRNAHTVFHTAKALLDFDVAWLYGEEGENYLSCTVSADALTRAIEQTPRKPAAVYLTSPDYLGNVTDIAPLAKICHQNGIFLLVDNAHGAYLKFLSPSRHPIDLGADLCCDSAHKTLSCLTGGAYLHISNTVRALFENEAKGAMALFGSTSPSYLILQSLDALNAALANGYAERLTTFVGEVEKLKKTLCESGYTLYENEPLKLTLQTKPYGYEGSAFAQCLRERGVECEFADPDFVVLMLTPETDLKTLEKALISIPQKGEITTRPPIFGECERVMSAREAMLGESERLPVPDCLGRVLASPSVACPPAVPIALCGERIDAHAVEAFHYYGITHLSVVK